MDADGSSKKLGIGFCTGRGSVIDIINNYIPRIYEQIEKIDKDMSLNILIAYDLKYQNAKIEEFFKLDPKLTLYPKLKIIHIGEKEIEKFKEEVKVLRITREDSDLFFGNGHDKGRNTILYNAVKMGINYLFYWDDDEYPVAVSNDGCLRWVPQNNILEHLKNIKNTDITHGYHCGYVSPIPYIELENNKTEKYFRTFIEALNNDIINWDNMKSLLINNGGITFVHEEDFSKSSCFVKFSNGGKWVSGSNICLDLDNLENIPAYYNPVGARGEDTFFSTMLKKSRVLKLPCWHFHDPFLNYTDIVKGSYPNGLKLIEKDKKNVKERFLKACIGWVRYKPLLLYISS